VIDEILVCIEGSPSGKAAIETGIRIARKLGADLVGLAIVDEPDIRAGAATGIGGASYKKVRDDALVEHAEAQVEKWLNEFSARCREAGVAARALEERGRPAATILARMETYDLVLMGRHANFKFETTANDSNTRDQILHRTRKPVLVVPEEEPPATNKILTAFDGSSAAKRAIASFADSGLGAGAEITVACVDDDGATAFELASRGVELYGQLGIKAQAMNIVSVLPIADALLEARAKLGASMIVMGAYAHSKIAQLLWGSVTRELVEKTPVPLYLNH
jgi:nucleotide-binding universal stress UspA family protein